MGIIGTTMRLFESRGLADFVDAQSTPLLLQKGSYTINLQLM